MTPVCKYGPMFPADSEREEIQELINKLIEKKCRCGNMMKKDAKFCSQCGLPREEALCDNLTADEKVVLFYVGNHSPLYINNLIDIPFYHILFKRFEAALHSLAKKGCITLSKTEAIFKKDAP